MLTVHCLSNKCLCLQVLRGLHGTPDPLWDLQQQLDLRSHGVELLLGLPLDLVWRERERDYKHIQTESITGIDRGVELLLGLDGRAGLRQAYITYISKGTGRETITQRYRV